MNVQAGQVISGIMFDTLVGGVRTAPDSLPSATLYRNGSASGVSVTVSNVATGLYTASWTNGAWDVGDQIQLSVSATISTVVYSSIIWKGQIEASVDSRLSAADFAAYDAPTKAEMDFAFAEVLDYLELPILLSDTVKAGDTGWVTVEGIAGNLATEGFLNDALMIIVRADGTKMVRWVRQHFHSSGDAGFNPDKDFTIAPENGDEIYVYAYARWTTNLSHWKGFAPSDLEGGLVGSYVEAMAADSLSALALSNDAVEKILFGVVALLPPNFEELNIQNGGVEIASASEDYDTHVLNVHVQPILTAIEESSCSGNGPWKLTVTVLAQDTSPISGAHLRVVNGLEEYFGVSDENGVQAFFLAGPATWSLFVSKSGYAGQEQDVLISSQDENVEIILEVAVAAPEENIIYTNRDKLNLRYGKMFIDRIADRFGDLDDAKIEATIYAYCVDESRYIDSVMATGTYKPPFVPVPRVIEMLATERVKLMMEYDLGNLDEQAAGILKGKLKTWAQFLDQVRRGVFELDTGSKTLSGSPFIGD